MTKLSDCETMIRSDRRGFRPRGPFHVGVLALCGFLLLAPLSNAIFTNASKRDGLGTLTFAVPQPQLLLTYNDGYVSLDFDMKATLSSHIDLAGAPRLPRLSLFIPMPWNARIVSCRITAGKRTELPGEHFVEPCDQAGFSDAALAGSKAQPNSTIYSLEKEYPGQLIEDLGVVLMSGIRATRLYVYPLQYVPTRGKLVWYSDLRLTIRYAVSAGAGSHDEDILVPSPDLRSASPLVRIYQGLLLKPDRATTRGGLVLTDALGLFPPQTGPRSWQADCALIGTAEMVPELRRLGDFYDSIGMPTVITTVESINTTYKGRDLPERIRNFVRDAFLHGVLYFVLAGDCDQIPPRVVKDPVPSGPDPGDVPCDYYYACLDGDWDADGDGVYGETDDSVDWFPETLVTRLPAANLTELRIMVDKTIEFERTPPSTWQRNILLVGADVLVQDDSKAFLERVKYEQIVPYTSATITELYEHEGLTTQSLLDEIERGTIAVTFKDHGTPSEWQMAGLTLLGKGDVENLKNFGRYPVVLAHACSTSYFDGKEDCLGETFLKAEGRGSVFYIGSSRLAWDRDPGAQSITTSFWEEICKKRVVNPVDALTNAKIQLASRYDPTSSLFARKTIYAFVSFGALIELPIFDSEDVQHPRLLDLRQSPQYPGDTDEVLVSARVLDRAGIRSVNLSYRLGDGPWVNGPMSRSVAVVATSANSALSVDDLEYLGVTHDLYTEANISFLFPRLADYAGVIIADYAASSPVHDPQSVIIRSSMASNQDGLLEYIEKGGGLWVSAQDDFSWLPGPLSVSNLGQTVGRRIDAYSVSSPIVARPNTLSCYATSSVTPWNEYLYLKCFADWDHEQIGAVHGMYESVAADTSAGTSATVWIAGSYGEGKVVLTTTRLSFYSGHSSTQASAFYRCRMALENLVEWISGGRARVGAHAYRIPSTSNETVVSYSVKATDLSGLTTVSPIQFYTVGLGPTDPLVTIGQAPLPADLNADGTVDVFDLVVVGRAMGSHQGSEHYSTYADLNADGVIDLYDLVLVARDFGEKASAAKGTKFYVDLSVWNVTNLYSCSFNVTYDPGMLDIVDVAGGSFLGSDGDPTLWVPPTINRTLGTVIGAGLTRTVSVEGVDGSGRIALLQFLARDGGTTQLGLQISLSDPEGQQIPSRLVSLEISIAV